MGSLHHWVGYLEPTWGLKWGKASISAINNKTEGQYGQMHTCVALRHNIDESKFSCYTNCYCVVCSKVLKGHHTIGQNKRVVNGPALGNINCRFLTVHQFSLFWMCLVSTNWWIGEIERNERKLRGQVEGREEERKRAKHPPPVSLYTVLSLLFKFWSFARGRSIRKIIIFILTVYSFFSLNLVKLHHLSIATSVCFAFISRI